MNKTVYVQHSRPILSIIISCIFGLILLPVKGFVRIFGIIWIIGHLALLFLIKDRITLIVTEKYIQVFDEEPGISTYVYLDEIKNWSFVPNGKDFDNVQLILNNNSVVRFPAMYVSSVSQALRKVMEDKQLGILNGYSKEDINIGEGIKSRIKKLKNKIFK